MPISFSDTKILKWSILTYYKASGKTRPSCLENTVFLQGLFLQYSIAMHPRDSSPPVKLESGFLLHKLTLVFANLSLGFHCPSLALPALCRVEANPILSSPDLTLRNSSLPTALPPWDFMIVFRETSDTVPISATYILPSQFFNISWGPDLPRSLDHMEDSMLTTEQIKIVDYCVLFQKTETLTSTFLSAILLYEWGSVTLLELAMSPSLLYQVTGRVNCPCDPPHCSFVPPWLRFWRLNSLSAWQSPPLPNRESHSHTPSKPAIQAASLNRVLTACVILNTVCTFPFLCITQKGPISCL